MSAVAKVKMNVRTEVDLSLPQVHATSLLGKLVDIELNYGTDLDL